MKTVTKAAPHGASVFEAKIAPREFRIVDFFPPPSIKELLH